MLSVGQDYIISIDVDQKKLCYWVGLTAATQNKYLVGNVNRTLKEKATRGTKPISLMYLLYLFKKILLPSFNNVFTYVEEGFLHSRRES